MDEIAETRPAVLVNVIDADGNIIASQIMDYEVPDFLRLRVDPEIAKGCTTVLESYGTFRIATAQGTAATADVLVALIPVS